jgi:hypothetical protein
MNKLKIWIAKQYAKAIERYNKKLADMMHNMTFAELAQFGEEMGYTERKKGRLEELREFEKENSIKKLNEMILGKKKVRK